jgi:hypothetical protein
MATKTGEALRLLLLVAEGRRGAGAERLKQVEGAQDAILVFGSAAFCLAGLAAGLAGWALGRGADGAALGVALAGPGVLLSWAASVLYGFRAPRGPRGADGGP